MSQNERNYAKLYPANTTALCDEAAELDTQVVGSNGFNTKWGNHLLEQS